MGIVVTNNGDTPHKGRFDGKDYAFPVGVPVSIPDAAAAHIFAFGKSDADRARILVKNGWQKNGTPGDPHGPDMAKKRLESFVFQVVTDEEVARAAKPKTKLPPPRVKTGVNAMSPLVEENGQRMPQGGPMSLPGSSAPLAPPAAQ